MATAYFGMCDGDTGSISGDTTDDSSGTTSLAVWDGSQTYTCPGSGPVTLTALEFYCRTPSGAPKIRIGLYSSDGLAKIAEGIAAVTVSGVTHSWQGHTGLSVVLTGGEAYRFFCGSTDASPLEFRSKSGGGAIGLYATGTDYTGGCPAALPSGNSNDFCQAFRATVTAAASGIPLLITRSLGGNTNVMVN